MLPSLTLPVNTFFQTFFSSSFGALSISSASVSSGRPPSRGVLCDINLSLPSCQHFFRNFLKNFFASFFPGFYPPLSSDWVPNLLLLSALMRFPWFQSVTCMHVCGDTRPSPLYDSLITPLLASLCRILCIRLNTKKHVHLLSDCF